MSKPSVLFLTHRVPYPPNRGDRIRTFNFLRHLATQADVWLASFADEPVSDATWKMLHSICHRVAIVPVEKRMRWVRAGLSVACGGSISVGAFSSPRFRSFVSEWSRQTQFAATLSSSSALTQYQRLGALGDVPAYVDLIDVDSQKWVDYAANSSGWRKLVYRIEGQRLRAVESDLADWTRGICVVSDAEADIYRSFRKTELIRAVPNGVDLDYFTPQSDASRSPTPEVEQNGCVFVGVLDYKPNVDGICWFAREVWPEVVRQRPDQKLRIVGREPVAAVRELASIPGLEVVGTVPDVRPYLTQASVAVVPLHIARGVQNKVLEALAMAKPVVASPEPLVGLDVHDGLDVFRAETKEQWVSALLRLFDDPVLRKEVGVAGQAYVTANHRWDQCLSSLSEFLGLSSQELASEVDREPAACERRVIKLHEETV